MCERVKYRSIKLVYIRQKITLLINIIHICWVKFKKYQYLLWYNDMCSKMLYNILYQCITKEAGYHLQRFNSGLHRSLLKNFSVSFYLTHQKLHSVICHHAYLPHTYKLFTRLPGKRQTAQFHTRRAIANAISK